MSCHHIDDITERYTQITERIAELVLARPDLADEGLKKLNTSGETRTLFHPIVMDAIALMVDCDDRLGHDFTTSYAKGVTITESLDAIGAALADVVDKCVTCAGTAAFHAELIARLDWYNRITKGSF